MDLPSATWASQSCCLPPCFQPDVLAVRSFRRHIMSFEIDPTDVGDSATGTRVYVLNIRGTAFLWHQVRGRDIAGQAMWGQVT